MFLFPRVDLGFMPFFLHMEFVVLGTPGSVGLAAAICLLVL